MADKASNIFSFFLGGLALISAITSTILYYRAFLPTAQMKILDDLLRETKDIYVKAEAEGLLPGTLFRRQVCQQLTCFERSSDNLREDAYQATTPVDEYIGLMKGLSSKIIRISHDVKKLRSLLITTSQLERLRREQQFAILESDADWSVDVTLPDSTNLIRTRDAAIQASQGVVEMTGSISSFLPPTSSSSTDRTWIDNPEYQGILSRAHPQGIDRAMMEQLAASPYPSDARAVCCVCSLLNWWRGRARRSSDNLRNLEDQSIDIPDSDTSSGSSTLIGDPAPRKSWSLLDRWRSDASQGETSVISSPQHPWYLGTRARGVGDGSANPGSLPL
ncbi:hypothetical protein BDZ94DRAFT_1259982 [Collybia nuda]|uniref:Uncharacterized protein n=1 Tax=Collybia nuda TaxID=64659 RepID=A0A9P5Y6E2_9AGAR|nr:hypothetical protein BDZ94DRAFT_1259982 [Collybia nuda]